SGQESLSSASSLLRQLSPTPSRVVRASLPSHLRRNRQVCASAELQGPILLAAAGAESDSGDYRREYDHALHVHGLLSYHVFGNRIHWLPGCDAQIKNAAAYPEVFHAG